MKTTPRNVEDFIRHGLPCDYIRVEGDGRHFEAVIVSPDFEGKSMLQQHKLVYQVLGEKMERIHALSMKTMTPVQWANKQ